MHRQNTKFSRSSTRGSFENDRSLDDLSDSSVLSESSTGMSDNAVGLISLEPAAEIGSLEEANSCDAATWMVPKTDSIAILRFQAVMFEEVEAGMKIRYDISVLEPSIIKEIFSRTVHSQIFTCIENGIVQTPHELMLPKTMYAGILNSETDTAPVLEVLVSKITGSGTYRIGTARLELPNNLDVMTTSKSLELACDSSHMIIFLLMIPVTKLDDFKPDAHWHSQMSSMGMLPCENGFNASLKHIQYTRSFSMVDIANLEDAGVAAADIMRVEVDRFTSYSGNRELTIAAANRTPVKIVLSLAGVDRDIHITHLPPSDVKGRQISLLRRVAMFPIDYGHFLTAKMEVGQHRFYGKVDIGPFAMYFYDGGETEGKIDLYDENDALVGHLVMRACFWQHKNAGRDARSVLRKIREDYVAAVTGEGPSNLPESFEVVQDLQKASLNLERCLTSTRSKVEEAQADVSVAIDAYESSVMASQPIKVGGLEAILELMTGSLNASMQYITGLYCSRIANRQVCMKLHRDIRELMTNQFRDQHEFTLEKFENVDRSTSFEDNNTLRGLFLQLNATYELLRRKIATLRILLERQPDKSVPVLRHYYKRIDPIRNVVETRLKLPIRQ